MTNNIKSIPEWKQFEIAIATFLKSLGGNAKITHDKNIPDKDTGTPRQRDVWIESIILGQFPIKIYVSCKYSSKKINQQDMDAIIGELKSSGAGQGAIYSKTGFVPNAILKAKKNNIFCCMLFQDKTPAIPDMLILKQYYCKSATALKCLKKPDKITIWNELFSLITNSTTVIDEIIKIFEDLEKHSLQEDNMQNLFPKDWSLKQTFEDIDNNKIELQLTLIWKIYESSLLGYLINGSYNFSENMFIGHQNGPIISLKKDNPGDGWTLLEKRPEITENVLISISSNPDFRNGIQDVLGSKVINI